MSYVSGFVAAVPTANKADYIKFCISTAQGLKKLGALQVVECWEAHVPSGKVTSFPDAVKKKPDESVVFSWVVWPSKAMSDSANEKMQAGGIPELDFNKNPPPFDTTRMIHGRFEPVLNTGDVAGDALPYVHGFAAAVPTANKAKYIQHCELAAKATKRLGALQTVECWGVDIPPGKVTSFPDAVKQKPDESVVFSWILWPSKAAGDAAMKKLEALEVPELDPEKNPMPLDGTRVIIGEFEMVVAK